MLSDKLKIGDEVIIPNIFPCKVTKVSDKTATCVGKYGKIYTLCFDSETQKISCVTRDGVVYLEGI